MRSYLNLAIILIIAAAIIAVIGILIHRTARGIRENTTGTASVSEAFVQQAPIPMETPVPVQETPAPASTEIANGLPPAPEADVNDWSLRLVRIDHPLPEDYQPELMEIERGEMFDARAAIHLKKLIEDARAAGFEVFVCSCFRSYDTQHLIYWNHVEEYMRDEGLTQEEAEAKTRIAVNYPGASEHQLGLAADLLEFQGQDMEPYIGGSGLMLWLEEHCADYGFVIRYPENKTEITGIEYEPWHLRYVGTCAWYLMENDLCLEEFLALYE